METLEELQAGLTLIIETAQRLQKAIAREMNAGALTTIEPKDTLKAHLNKIKNAYFDEFYNVVCNTMNNPSEGGKKAAAAMLYAAYMNDVRDIRYFSQWLKKWGIDNKNGNYSDGKMHKLLYSQKKEETYKKKFSSKELKEILFPQ